MAKRRSSQATWDAEAVDICAVSIARPPPFAKLCKTPCMHQGLTKWCILAFHDPGIIGSHRFTRAIPDLLGDKVDGLLALAHDQIDEGSLVKECMQICSGSPLESFLSAEQVYKLVESVTRLDTTKKDPSGRRDPYFHRPVQSGMVPNSYRPRKRVASTWRHSIIDASRHCSCLEKPPA